MFGVNEFEALQKYESTERIGPAVSAALEMDLLSKTKRYFFNTLCLIVVMLRYLLLN